MASKNVTLTDKNGDYIYPLTYTNNIFTKDNRPLEDVLENLELGVSHTLDTIDQTSNYPVASSALYTEFQKYLPLTGGDLSGDLNLPLGKYFRTDGSAILGKSNSNLRVGNPDLVLQLRGKNKNPYYNNGTDDIELVLKTDTIENAVKAEKDNLGNVLIDSYLNLKHYSKTIESGTNLNSSDYFEIGNYICHNNTIAGSLTNAPTKNAFVMYVTSSIKQDGGNLLTDNYMYRLRIISDYVGNIYSQGIYTNGTAGNFTIENWKRLVTNEDLDGYLPLDGSAVSATKATQDSSGNVIVDTYVKKTSVNSSNATKPFDKIPFINSAGVMEVGTYVDFHSDNTTGNDYSTRLYSNGENKNAVKLPSGSGTLALTTDNVASATKATQDGNGNVITNTYLKLTGGTLTGAINLNSGYPQIKTNQPDFVIQTAGGQQYDFTNTEFRPTASYVDTLSIGKSDRRFKNIYLNGNANIKGGQIVRGNTLAKGAYNSSGTTWAGLAGVYTEQGLNTDVNQRLLYLEHCINSDNSSYSYIRHYENKAGTNQAYIRLGHTTTGTGVIQLSHSPSSSSNDESIATTNWTRDSIDITSVSTDMVTLVKGLINTSDYAKSAKYARWICKINGVAATDTASATGSYTIANIPLNVAFTCEAICNRLASATDYGYQLRFVASGTHIIYRAYVNNSSTSLTWYQDVMTVGNQTIAGNKTFSGTVSANSLTGNAVYNRASINALTAASTWANNAKVPTLTTLAYWDGRYQTTNNQSNLNYCKNGVIIGASNAQTISGVKTFSSAPKISATLATTLNDSTVATTAWIRKVDSMAGNNDKDTNGDGTVDKVPKQNQHDTVIEYWIASNKLSWYRLWASGWLEQGVWITGSSSTEANIILPKAYGNTDYNIESSIYYSSSSAPSGSGTPSFNTVYNLLPMLFNQRSDGFKTNRYGSTNIYYSFYCCGVLTT